MRKVANNPNFSARETKLLRKLINKQKKEGYLNFTQIQDDFPGKTLENLESKYNEKYLHLLRRRRSSKLDEFDIDLDD